MTQAEKDQEHGKEKEKERDKEKEQRGVKRPIAPAAVPELPQEQTQSSSVVVIHPGSRTLRIGRATDTLPAAVPHLVARRHKHSEQNQYQDQWILRDGTNKPESSEQRLNGLKMVEQAIWSKKMSNGVRRTAVSAEQARAYNCQVRPSVTDSGSRLKWTNTSHQPQTLVGDEALYVNPSDCYNVHWPVLRGGLNLHSGPGGSLSAVMADLHTIWSHALLKHLDIPLKDLKYYRCILLVPDIYNRQHVRHLVDLLLLQMGFSGIIVHQESVCASFGSGLSSACVVDVGDQKTSVCCVEDGVSHRNSRLCLSYGGSDVSRTFLWLLQRAGFPYRDCDLNRRLDCALLQQLKEDYCHLDQDTCGLMDHEFQTRFPESPTRLYQLRLGDEKLQAPMALFYPSTFGIVGQKMTFLQHRSHGDAEDPYDEQYLLTTQSKQEQSSRWSADRRGASRPGTDADLSTPAADLCDTLRGSGAQAELLETPTPGEAAGGAEVDQPLSHHLSHHLSRKNAVLSQFESKALGLDKAILHSIDCCASDETKRKMYSSILVVGGGLMFRGAQEFLLHRVINKMPPSFRRLLDSVEVITRPKDLDPRVVSWKGGAVLACLDTTQELWILQDEWRRFGVRMLRERGAFVW